MGMYIYTISSSNRLFPSPLLEGTEATDHFSTVWSFNQVLYLCVILQAKSYDASSTPHRYTGLPPAKMSSYDNRFQKLRQFRTLNRHRKSNWSDASLVGLQRS